MWFHLHTISEETFPLDCMAYKRNEVRTTTKLKDKAIRISYLKYFKNKLTTISNVRR